MRSVNNRGVNNQQRAPVNRDQQNLQTQQMNTKTILPLPMDGLALMTHLSVIESLSVLDHAFALLHAQQLQLTEENLRKQFLMVIQQQLQTMANLNQNIMAITSADIERTVDAARQRVASCVPQKTGMPTTATPNVVKKVAVVSKVVESLDEEEGGDTENDGDDGDAEVEDVDQEPEPEPEPVKPVKKVTRTNGVSRDLSRTASNSKITGTAATKTVKKTSSAITASKTVGQTSKKTVKK